MRSANPAIRGPAGIHSTWRRSCKTSYRDRHRVESTSVSMDLNTITDVAHPQSREQLPVWTAGDAWLAGGTWLFSEPQAHLTRLIDLTDFKWPALTIGEAGLTIAATCTVAELDALACPPEWIAAPLIDQCCRAFLASFKIWKTATVGGNLCMSLPAALDGVSLPDGADAIQRRHQPDDRADGGAGWRLHHLEG